MKTKSVRDVGLAFYRVNCWARGVLILAAIRVWGRK